MTNKPTYTQDAIHAGPIACGAQFDSTKPQSCGAELCCAELCCAVPETNHRF